MQRRRTRRACYGGGSAHLRSGGLTFYPRRGTRETYLFLENILLGEQPRGRRWGGKSCVQRQKSCTSHSSALQHAAGAVEGPSSMPPFRLRVPTLSLAGLHQNMARSWHCRKTRLQAARRKEGAAGGVTGRSLLGTTTTRRRATITLASIGASRNARRVRHSGYQNICRCRQCSTTVVPAAGM